MKYEKKFNTKAEDTKIFDELNKYRHICKCGHVVIISKQNKALCSYCGNWVFKNKEEEFKFRLMEKIGKKYE